MPVDQSFVAQIGAQLARQGDARPLYRQLADAIAQEMPLADGYGHLPSERTLSSKLGVSRVTVRRALDELAADGLLVRRQGARTVMAERMEKALSTLTGFSDELRARGQEPGQRWLARQTVLPSPAEAMALDLPGNEAIVRLVRVRLADDQPIAIERAAVPQSLLPSGELVEDSLYDALKRLDAQPVRGVQRIRAGIMTRADAELLDSSSGSPLLIVERRCFLGDGRPVEFTETRYDGERYDFLTELRS
ncbi:MAG: GntR family transcriptional regulator [Pseudomonadota bacterium]